MLDHVSVAVRDLPGRTEEYRRVLAPLGLTLLVERPGTSGFGKAYPEFWLNARADMAPLPSDTGIHICLRAANEDAVRAFHAQALSSGWTDAGPPGPRQAAMTLYYAAFVQDKDGNKLEAANFPRKA